MRWTFLDYVLLTSVVIAAVLFHHHTALATNCQVGLCAPLKIYSTAGVAFYEFKHLDCRKCVGAGYCEQGPWGSNCQANSAVNQEIRDLTSADLKCSCGSPVSTCEAWSDSGEADTERWEGIGKQEWCHDPP